MRTATRLLLALGTVLVMVMSAYGLYSQRQQEALLGDAHLRDTDMMAHLIAGVLSDAAVDGRQEDVTALLERAREHPEVLALALVDSEGGVLSGRLPADRPCLSSVLEAVRTGGPARGSVECDGRVDWAILPSGVGDAVLLVARRATALEREVAATRRQVIAVTGVLIFLGATVIVLILRRTLTLPLEEMLRAVERFGDPRFNEPVAVPEYPGELGGLAVAFNDLDRRLEEKKKWIIREVEERLELEGQLRKVEPFAEAGRIVGALAHEIGSPLNVIGVRAEAILNHGSVSEEARRQAQEIVDEVDRIAALVRSLSHIDRNGLVEPREMDLGTTVRGASEDLAESARESGVEIVTELPEEPVLVLGDPSLLRLAVRNLAANALQAAEEEGPGIVRLRIVEGESQVAVEVEDDGPGVSPEVLPRIFEPFFTTKKVGKGTGLGLSTALGIVERHGGRLSIESRPGEGVRAVLTLPRGTHRTTELPA